MKLATYTRKGEDGVGLVREDGDLVDLSLAFAAAGLKRTVADMMSLFDGVDLADLRRAEAASDDLPTISSEQVSWLPPVRRPSKIVGVVINNKSVASTASFIADHPIFFTYPPSALIGHGEAIVIRPDYGLTHPEAELGVVLGRRVKSVAVDDALEAVFGYTIVNDVTSVDLKSADTVVFKRSGAESFTRTEEGATPPGFEHGDMQLTYHARSKGTDTFAPCGPWVVTRDELPDPNDLGVRLFMGDELCTEDNTGNLTFGVAEVLAHVSRYLTLEPGDIVHMGTAATGKYKLREIDFQTWDGPCAIEIDGIGTLTSPILRQADA
jgi:2-keto-4-pentenoate hydratase/2-oxohepta-3-ene-1,7-dioic acid hydratase in catechol pathway